MKNKLNIVLILSLCCFAMHAQGKWTKDLVVNYKMTDKNDKIQNSIKIKKDTLLYEYLDKDKVMAKKIVGDTALENEILKVIEKNKVLKFKSATIVKGSPNIVFTYNKNGKEKMIIMPQFIKAGSKEEQFIREFIEPIILKAFEHELKSSVK